VLHRKFQIPGISAGGRVVSALAGAIFREVLACAAKLPAKIVTDKMPTRAKDAKCKIFRFMIHLTDLAVCR